MKALTLTVLLAVFATGNATKRIETYTAPAATTEIVR
jgi:hypothetical protein